jgi:hypothetical protein
MSGGQKAREKGIVAKGGDILRKGAVEMSRLAGLDEMRRGDIQQGILQAPGALLEDFGSDRSTQITVVSRNQETE